MLRGVYTALVTPFNQDLSIDEGALRAVILCDLEGFGERAERLDIALDTHVAQEEERRGHRRLSQR